MKRSEEFLGLSLISIEDGKELGRVSDLIIDPGTGSVAYLIIDGAIKYLGLKILSFDLVEGVGEYAVTVQSSSAVIDLFDEPEIAGLLEKDVRVKGTRILTKKGKLIGVVSEFFIDEESLGKITGCELTAVDGAEMFETISADQIITFGKDIIVIKEGMEIVAAKRTSAAPKQSAEVAEEQIDAPKNEADTRSKDRQEPSQAAVLFEQRQRQYMLGRKASKRIETDNGELIAEEDEIITEEMMDRAKNASKFSELSMNTKP